MDILSHFRFEDVGRRIEDLETPVPVIDIAIAERNLLKWQARCDKAGFANRPHIKTHKLVAFAKAQLALGARGITVQKLGEAEVMADAGIDDMLLTFNIVGSGKLERLSALMRRSAIKTVCDNTEMLEGLGYAAQKSGRTLDVLAEADTGAKRNGVQTPEACVVLAQAIDRTPGLRFAGLMTYPRAGLRKEADAFFAAARDLAAPRGIGMDIVSTGGSPDMWKDEGLANATEYRAGTYIYFDRSLAERGTCEYSDCALTILATVVSKPTADRAMIDAGSKTLTSDLLGLSGYGVAQSLGGAKVYDLSEEHGFLDISGAAEKPRVGDLLRITPNHVCPVTNLFDKVVIVRGDDVLGAVAVDARGKVQ
jgi:D-serine deaminase-like pyridoxal phosphate-dependent protein